MAKNLKILANVAKFRQIWSHWTKVSLNGELTCFYLVKFSMVYSLTKKLVPRYLMMLFSWLGSADPMTDMTETKTMINVGFIFLRSKYFNCLLLLSNCL